MVLRLGSSQLLNAAQVQNHFGSPRELLKATLTILGQAVCLPGQYFRFKLGTGLVCIDCPTGKFGVISPWLGNAPVVLQEHIKLRHVKQNV